MRLNMLKKYIGLCACKGCFKRASCCVEIAAEKAGVTVIHKKFYVCSDCTFKVLGLED